MLINDIFEKRRERKTEQKIKIEPKREYNIDKDAVQETLSRLYPENIDIRIVDAADIRFVNQPEKDEYLWEAKQTQNFNCLELSEVKEKYTELAEALPYLYDLLSVSDDLRSFFSGLKENDPEMYKMALQWFDNPYNKDGRMIHCELVDGVLGSDDGRHRVYTARCLNIPIPVVIDAEYIIVNGKPVRADNYYL